MNAQIITIGDEILIGQIVDTNSAWLASELTKIGFTISQMQSISDNENYILTTLAEALKANQLVIVTGGLGPTKDDVTKKSLCHLFNTELEFNDSVYSDVEAFLIQRGAKMNVLNRDQALVPKRAKVLRNQQGTAPGMWFEQNGNVLISLPGVPWEMKAIFTDVVTQMLKSFFSLPKIYYQTLMISGLGESQLALMIENWENNLSNSIKVAYLPSPGIIRLRLGIKGENLDELKQTIANEVKKLHTFIGKYMYSDTEVTLQEIVGKLLIDSNKTLSTAESCTGGLISELITSIPGSSNYFKGAVVAYANEIKMNVLNVNPKLISEYGAVSQAVVESMAVGAKKCMNTDYSVATSGIAGPDGGSLEKPVGTVWIAVAGPNKTISKQFTFGNERDINIKRTAITALNMLRQLICNEL